MPWPCSLRRSLRLAPGRTAPAGTLALAPSKSALGPSTLASRRFALGSSCRIGCGGLTMEPSTIFGMMAGTMVVGKIVVVGRKIAAVAGRTMVARKTMSLRKIARLRRIASARTTVPSSSALAGSLELSSSVLALSSLALSTIVFLAGSLGLSKIVAAAGSSSGASRSCLGRSFRMSLS